MTQNPTRVWSSLTKSISRMIKLKHILNCTITEATLSTYSSTEIWRISDVLVILSITFETFAPTPSLSCKNHKHVMSLSFWSKRFLTSSANLNTVFLIPLLIFATLVEFLHPFTHRCQQNKLCNVRKPPHTRRTISYRGV